MYKGVNMKKTALVSVILAGALLMTSCSIFETGSKSRRSRRDRDDDDDDNGSPWRTEQTAETSEETIVTTAATTVESTAAPVETTVTGGISDAYRSAAYRDYLSIIESEEDDIRAYDWMGDWSGSGSGVLAADENTQLALYDVTGDGLEELFIMKINTQYTYMAQLEVYSYDTAAGSAYSILELDNFDEMAGGGGRYAIAPMDPGFLLVYTCMVDEDTDETYSVYMFNGSVMVNSGSINAYSYPDDNYNYVTEYSMNGSEIDEIDFDDARTEVFDYIEALCQYNYIRDTEMVSALSSVDCYAMSYDDMHDLLSSYT